MASLTTGLIGHALELSAEVVMRAPAPLLLQTARHLLERAVDMPEGQRFLHKLLAELRRKWGELHPNVRRRFVRNVFGNLMLLSGAKHARATARLGDWPSIMVVSPTMRCNLRCEGCYSANYAKEDVLTTPILDRLLTECEELGIYFVVVSGGEPFLRRDLLDLFGRHPDIQFLVYTNGTLLPGSDIPRRLAELGNVAPCVSVEGFEGETDARRGDGTFRAIDAAMDELRAAGVLFGFSATPMRSNNELLVSDTFIDHYIAKGCFLGWYFSYMPVGRAPDLERMPTPEQRLHRMRRIREIRATKPIVAADFWCDGELVGGCLSAGRVYFHVNASGGVEPCVFHQFSVDSVLDKPLLEALDSPYFRHLRGELAKVDNPLRPCVIIDRPEVMREAVRKFEAAPSQAGGDALLSGAIAEGLDRYAAELKEVMDPEFEQRRQNFRWSRVQRPAG